jgi:protein-S-isoprenylcysteine O-methyltransferase Ste14
MPIDLTAVATYFLIACWFAFASIFLLRKKQASGTEVRRDRSAFIPIAVQGISFGIVWTARRHHGTALITTALTPYLDVLACVLAVSSVSFVLVSVRTLGKQWTVAARLVEGHNLVTQGPYRVVRNPIYTGMFGMLVATGIVLARWPAVLIAIAIFLAATMQRIRVEERLLRSQFGAEFEQYCEQVPNALLPGL